MSNDLRPVAALTHIAGIPQERPPGILQCVLPPTFNTSDAKSTPANYSRFIQNCIRRHLTPRIGAHSSGAADSLRDLLTHTFAQAFN